ncbi:NYN domain-containing protein [Candidatus Poriferisocius sp.]|uniref:NYN domain-containing protein n=1 Tax=Candidatus Poriferisocius sp. TaxID=3101276 RepID=UPI003B01311B
MRVGVYIDGLNLYYGGQHLCGGYERGWRWHDVSALANRLISRNPRWAAQEAAAHRIVYCTAIFVGEENFSTRHQQETYLAALRATGRIVVEEGTFVARHVSGQTTTGGVRMTIKVYEEKGSDVNVASHLLIDLHTDQIDAAVLIANDSDLRLPAQHAREHLPLGTVNPRGTPTAQALRGRPNDGTGGHWWYSLTSDDFFACQLPKIVGGHRWPPGW